MVVDPKRKIAFIHNPKAAGTSVRTALLEALGCPDFFRYQGFIYNHERRSVQMHNMSHLDWYTFHQVLSSDPERWGNPEEYRYFGVVRDPYERLKSSILEFQAKHSSWLARVAPSNTLSSAIGFLLEMLTPESIWNPEFSWFKPQHVFFPEGNFDVTMAFLSSDAPSIQDVWDLNFSDTPVKFGHLNQKSGAQPLHTFSIYEQELRSLARYLYADDYRMIEDRFGVPRPIDPVKFHNTRSYMWTVRGIQTNKVDPCVPVASVQSHDNVELVQQIQNTQPFILVPNET